MQEVKELDSATPSQRLENNHFDLFAHLLIRLAYADHEHIRIAAQRTTHPRSAFLLEMGGLKAAVDSYCISFVWMLSTQIALRACDAVVLAK